MLKSNEKTREKTENNVVDEHNAEAKRIRGIQDPTEREETEKRA